MALLWFDGFDHYTATSGDNFDALSWQGSYALVEARGNGSEIRNNPEGGLAYVWDDNDIFLSSSGAVNWALPAAKSTGTLGIGCHFNTELLASAAIFGVSTNLSNNSSSRLFIAVNTTGNIVIRQHITTLATSAGIWIAAAQTYHIEAKFTFNGSGVGQIEVRVNGQTALTHTLSGTTAMNYVTIHPPFAVSPTGVDCGVTYYDDLYIWDESGTLNNNWLGERAVLTRMPNADTVDADWTPSTGTDGYAIVDNIPPTAANIESTSVGDVSVFDVQDLVDGEINIVGVMTQALASKTGSEPASFTIGPVGDPSGNQALTETQFLRFHKISSVDPNTGEPWSPAAIDSLQIRIERTV